MIYSGPCPFKEVIAIAQRRGLLPNNLSSAQLSYLDTQLKRRAIFSARMDKGEVLQILLNTVRDIGGGMPIAEENGRLRNIPEAKAQLREAMFRAGVLLAPVGTRPIQDFYSDGRRQLMVETTLLDTLGFGRHVATQNPEMLYVNPGLELVRVIEPKGGEAAKRPWIKRWIAAMEAIGSDAESGCTDPRLCGGRMVALKNHPIWQALGDGAGGYRDGLGNPWAPFAFNSGMNTIDVSRADCVALKIIGPNERIEPEEDFDMNENLEASMDRFDEALQDQLKGDGLEILDGALRLVHNARRARVETAINASFTSTASRLLRPALMSRRRKRAVLSLLGALQEGEAE